MLRELSVQNLALIEDARIELRPGYCAWTGETGAGKSLLLTALGLILGGKASCELVRKGKDEARAAAVFEVSNENLRSRLESILGGRIDDDLLILTRRINAQGRSSCHANGLPIGVATLKALGELLIDIHGQHENRALMEPEGQRDLLDAFASIAPLLNAYREKRDEHARLLRGRAELLENAANLERERALLVFERDELLVANPTEGEHEELCREAHRLANAESIRTAATEGFATLYESDRSAQGLLESVGRKLSPLADTVPEFAEAVANLKRLSDETREVAYSLRKYGRDSEDDPVRLEDVENRLATFRKLAAHFRCLPDELPERLREVQNKLATIETIDLHRQSLDKPISDAWREVCRTSAALTSARTKACRSFAAAVRSQIKGMGLDTARIAVDLKSVPAGDDPFMSAAPEHGADVVEFLFSPNPGEDPRPLRKIASGGEMSRVMLAVKVALSKVDPVPTLVFDEIDTGVGGRLGAALGRKLSELARHHQVICVTHLPQMASHAAHQWIIRKKTDRGRTRTTISHLAESERVDELASMLRGESAAEGTRQEARSMLLEARGQV